MGRRWATRSVLGAAVLVAAAMGVAWAALRTGAGREVVVRWALQTINRNLVGSLTAETVGGSWVEGLEVRNLVVRDPEGEVLARFPRLQLRYRLIDLLGGKLVFGQLTLDHPELRLIEDSTGRLNLERVLGLGHGEGGPAPLVAFRDVRLNRGRISIRTWNGGAGSERTIENLTATFPYLRLSSSLPGEEAVRFEVEDLQARLSDPELEVRGLEGRVDVWGDSLVLALDRLELPRSEARVAGSIRWPDGAWWYNLEIASSRFAPADLQWLVSWFPEGLTGSVRAAVRSSESQVLEVHLDRLALRSGRPGEGLAGNLDLVLGPGEEWALQGADLRFSDFSLEYLRSMFDTLPLAGRLSGRLQASGPRDRLRVELDWLFRDSLVPGWPESQLRGGGIVSLADREGVAFDGFALRRGEFDWETVNRLVPLGLRGTLEAAGTLDGPWRHFQFSGTLRQRDEPYPPSTVRGVLRVDSRRDTVGIWADWAVDSLSLSGLRTSYSWLGLEGAFAGDLKLSGYLDSLGLSADLAGPAGRIRAQGSLLALAPPWGAHEIEVEFSRLDLGTLRSSLPQSQLNGSIRGSVRWDSLGPLRGELVWELDSSHVAGTPIDSAAGELGVSDSVLLVDSLTLWAPGFALWGKGSLGLAENREGSMVLRGRSDSLATFGPLGSWLWDDGRSAPDTFPTGVADLRVEIRGSTRRWSAGAELQLAAVRWGPWKINRAAARGQWKRGRADAVAVELEADSLHWRQWSLSLLAARLSGRLDSLGWFARSRVGQDVSGIAGGVWLREGSRVAFRLDSLALLLPSEVWFLEDGAQVVAADGSLDFGIIRLVSVSGRGRVELAGRLANQGRGRLTLRTEALPLGDLWAVLQHDPAEVGGEVSGTLQLEGTASAPEIDGSLALSDLVFRGFSARYLDGRVQYREQRLTGAFGLWRSGQRIVEISLELPLELALRPVPDRRLPGRLSARVTADGVDLSFLEAMIPHTRNTAGRLFADFGIAGSWTRPELNGSVAVSDAAVALPALGVRYEQLDGRLTLSGDTIRIDTLSLRSGEGFAVISGYVRLEELTRPILSLRMRGNNFRTMDVRDFLSFTASGDFRLEGPVLGARLSGSGTVDRGLLYFKDLITKEVINLEDPRYADLIDTSLIRRQRLGAEFEIRFLDSLRIDSLILEMGQDVWMRSSEANVQLTGRLAVNKVRNRYRLEGTLETPRGTYRLPLTTFVTREFTVTRGQLQYFGTPDLNAAVDIEARHVVRRLRENINITVHIGGTLYSPRLSFTSDIHPPISEAEIMSYLIFGTSSFQALAQGAEGRRNAELINSALSRLAGVISGQFEQAIANFGLPLDYFQIRPSEVGVAGLSGTEVAVGMQRSLFGVPTFLTLSPRICPQASDLPVGLGFSAEGRLSRHWLLALSRDAVGPCAALGAGDQIRYQLGLDLFWERIY